jgi:hypothetical protein
LFHARESQETKRRAMKPELPDDEDVLKPVLGKPASSGSDKAIQAETAGR